MSELRPGSHVFDYRGGRTGEVVAVQQWCECHPHYDNSSGHRTGTYRFDVRWSSGLVSRGLPPGFCGIHQMAPVQT